MTRSVTVRTDGGGTIDAALAEPDGDGPFPGVVVLHEIFGLNDDIRRITDRFAENGYVAVAPDLYSHGNRALCLTRVLLSSLVDGARAQTLADIDAARRHVVEMGSVDGMRVAVVGFCLGGGFALIAGTRPGFAAAGVNYGMVPQSRDAIAGVCPVVASYGSLDRSFRPHAERLERYLAELGVPHDVKVYDGVGHAFLSYDNAPGWVARLPFRMSPGYRETEAEDAWRRMLAFLDEHVVSR